MDTNQIVDQKWPTLVYVSVIQSSSIENISHMVKFPMKHLNIAFFLVFLDSWKYYIALASFHMF